MRRMINFVVGTISTLGVSQTLFAAEQTNLNTDISSALNTIVSIIGGILSTVVVAYLQHRWRMSEDDRRWKREHPSHKNKKLD